MTNTITLPRSVVEQALSTLEGWSNYDKWVWHESALSTAKQNTAEIVPALRAALVQPQVEQSSVVGVIGWKNHLPNSGTVVHWTALMPPLGTKLYIHPQPPRQPLTDEQIISMWEFPNDLSWMDSVVRLVRAIERAHGIGGEA